MLVLTILQNNCHSQINNKLEEDTGLAAKGESEPERKETRCKVEDDRKHEYPFKMLYYVFKRILC